MTRAGLWLQSATFLSLLVKSALGFIILTCGVVQRLCQTFWVVDAAPP